MTAKWTREQFEDYYNDGDRAWIEAGYLSIECHEAEGHYTCHGWKMTTFERLADDMGLYHNTPDEVAVALMHRQQLKFDALM